MADNVALVTDPTVDLGKQLRFLMGDTGALNEATSGYRIQVFHTRAFPWDEVFKTLLYRDYKVCVTRQKADLYIEATR
ncbi:MAG TPA: hypothetical protein VK324_16855 [Tepidisphaeraceae bacterium]|nr:hypothetical protein [Tepidisphaeraceae bacterium]